jgi:predicted nuclease of restriction endonuclease-like (RecB) superfamily
MDISIAADGQYKKWLIELKKKIQVAQIKAAMRVNHQLLNTYWELGKEITAKQQQANWGEALIPQLSKDLSTAFPEIKGFSRTNLFYIRQWYLFYHNASDKVQQLVGQIPWGHNCMIISKCFDIGEAQFYVQETMQNNWSRAVLSAQIESNVVGKQQCRVFGN